MLDLVSGNEALLRKAHDALEGGGWSTAKDAFEAVLESEESAEARFGLGIALWWLGETRPSIECYERAYAAFRRVGDATRAAWAAMWLCLTYKSDLGNQAAASGWIGRAERALQGADPGPLQG
jgi:tetratricopeptide (TPR) repeat protein